MEHKFNMELKSEIMERQAEFLFEKAYELVGETATEEEVSAIVADTLRRYYIGLGRPLMIKRHAERDHLPWIEDYNDTAVEVTEDVSILFKEIEVMGDYLAEYFNYAQSEKERIQYRIRGVSGLTNDLNLISNDSNGNALFFRESFDDTSGIEPSMIIGRAAQIATQEGVVTLARNNTINRSQKGSIRSIQGNGDPGTYHIVRKAIISTRNGSQTVANYISDHIPNDNPEVVLDGRPDTIFEYQMVNIEREAIMGKPKGYDFEWVKGARNNDKLRLKIVIELEGSVDINWISLNPYNAPFSTGKVTVYSIRTSEDGFDYQPLYSGGMILNSQINNTPQTYRADAIFDGNNDFSESKFAGQGVWAFPTRKARFVELVIDQDESYDELIGHTYYEKTIRSSGDRPAKTTRIPASQAPKNVVDGPPGTYSIDSETQIIKGIEYKEFEGKGWRYAIGIRDINIMSYEFEEKSEFVSKRYETEEPIRKIMLYANEKIPKEYLNIVSTGNDWIQYYVSVDDVNWHRISPMHHQPLSKEGFPPKIIEINGNKTDLLNAFQLYKSYLDTEQEVKGVRLKVVLQRPKDIPNASTTTPILEDYALRVVFEDKDVEN